MHFYRRKHYFKKNILKYAENRVPGTVEALGKERELTAYEGEKLSECILAFLRGIK